MAGKIRGITIEIDGNTKKFQDSLKGMDSQLNKSNKKLRDINKLLKLKPGNTELLTQKQKTLSKAIETTESRLKELKNVQRENVSPEEWDAIQREIIDTESKLESLNKEMKDFGSVSAQQIKAVGTKLQSVGDGMKEVGGKLTTSVTLPLVGVGTAAAKVGMDFDAEMSKVAAISGATGEDFDALREKAREMGRNTKFSATEAGEGFEYMAMAGWKTNDMLEGIGPILNLATASGEELGAVSDIVTDALTAFGLSAEDSARFADVLAAASSNANTNVGMLGESFKYVAPVAGSLGFSAEDTSIALGLMANSGIKASSAGTALRTILTNMSNPTDKMADAMDRLGVSLTDDQGNMNSLGTIMDQLRSGFSSLKDMTDEQKDALSELDAAYQDGSISEEEYNAALEDMFGSMDDATGASKAQVAAMLAGKTGMSGLLAIVNAGEDDYNALTDAIYNCDGATQEMSDRMMDNAAGSITEMKSAISDAAIAVSDVLAPGIEKVADFIADLANKFSELSPLQQDIIVKVGLLAAAIGPLLMVVGSIVSTIGTLMTFAPMIATFLAGPVAPMVALGVAIAALATLIAFNWDKIKVWTKNMINVIKGEWDRFKKLTSESFNNVKNKVVTTVGSVKAKINDLASSVKTKFQSIKDSITKPINTAWELVKSAVDKIKGIFPISMGKIFSGIKLPHFKISGGEVPWGIGGKGTRPSVGIEWYAKGGIFRQPTVLSTPLGYKGVGEAGAEAVLPLDSLWNGLREMGDDIVNGIARTNAGSGEPVVINLYAYPSGPKMEQWVVDTYDRGKRRLG